VDFYRRTSNPSNPSSLIAVPPDNKRIVTYIEWFQLRIVLKAIVGNIE
jgi:hypothetical protein